MNHITAVEHLLGLPQPCTLCDAGRAVRCSLFPACQECARPARGHFALVPRDLVTIVAHMIEVGKFAGEQGRMYYSRTVYGVLHSFFGLPCIINGDFSAYYKYGKLHRAGGAPAHIIRDDMLRYTWYVGGTESRPGGLPTSVLWTWQGGALVRTIANWSTGDIQEILINEHFEIVKLRNPRSTQTIDVATGAMIRNKIKSPLR